MCRAAPQGRVWLAGGVACSAWWAGEPAWWAGEPAQHPIFTDLACTPTYLA